MPVHPARKFFDSDNKKKMVRFFSFCFSGVMLIGASFYAGYFLGSRSVPAPVEAVDVSIDDDAMLGEATAPVTIIEFSDYECPYCRRHSSQTLPLIKENYIDSGKVRYVFRDFPLDFHPAAQKAAEAAECAGEQGKYWEMHALLFANQFALRIENFKAWAAELALDQSEFDACLESGSMASEVLKDFKAGQIAGVSGTPTIFVNGKPISGARPYPVFKSAINAALAEKN